MVRNFALTFAAVTLRVWLPAGTAAGVPFAVAYPVVAWLCWVPNLLAAEALIRTIPRGFVDAGGSVARHALAAGAKR
jgi:hypothetical protein